MVITIDGPSGSGKGTTARGLAKKLEMTHVDSGSLYRAIAWYLDDRSIAPDSTQITEPFLEQIDISYSEDNTILINGVDREEQIRSRENSIHAFTYSRNQIIRKYVTRLQRMLLVNGGVLDGRDAGSVVMPDADLKIYLDCNVDIRTYRRAKQHKITEPLEIAKIKGEILARDEADRNKGEASLRVLSDAIVVDTSDLSVQEQIDTIYRLAQEKLQT